MDKRISNPEQIAYVKRLTLCGGKEDGLRIIEVDTGRIRFWLNESKALDIARLWHDGKNIGFLSKNGLTKREISFSKRFEGGMLYTCGLDSVGGRDGFETHGSLHNIPALVKRAECDGKKIVVEAEICDTELFGKNLKVIRRVSCDVLGESICVEDTLENVGTKDENYCLLYHVNVGYPMLSEGTTINTPAKKIVPRTEYAEKCLEERSVFLPPKDNEEERCYFLSLEEPKVTVKSELLSKELILTYSGDTLPHFVQWNSNASHDYALGIEPSTTMLDERFEYKKLSPNEEVRFFVNVEVKNI